MSVFFHTSCILPLSLVWPKKLLCPPLLFRIFRISYLTITFIEISHKVPLIYKNFHKVSLWKELPSAQKFLCKVTASQWGTESLQNYGLAWIVEFTIIFRTSRYSNISWYEHFTLVHRQGDTSLQTVVANSILKKKIGLNLIKFSIWPLLGNIERSQTLHSYYPLTPPHTTTIPFYTYKTQGGGNGGFHLFNGINRIFFGPVPYFGFNPSSPSYFALDWPCFRHLHWVFTLKHNYVHRGYTPCT